MIINSDSRIVEERLREIGTDAFAAFFAIASHLRTTRTAWPGIDRLCKMCPVEIAGELRDMPTKRMYKAIRRLIDAEMVERTQARDEKADWGHTKYQVTERYISVYHDITRNEMIEEKQDNSRTVEFGDARNGDARNDHTEAISKVELSIKGENLRKTWNLTGDERLDQAAEKVYTHFAEEPTRWKAIRDLARNHCTKKEFITELDAWLRYHRDNVMIMQDPVSRLPGGKNSFFSWLSQPWCKAKYDPKQKQKKGQQQQPSTYDAKVPTNKR
jgi:hypothetical protein